MSSFFLRISRSLSAKLLFVSLLVLLLTVLAILFPLRVEMRRQIVSDLQNELRAIASTSAIALDGDALATITSPAAEATPAFRILREQLRAIRDSNGLTQDNIYTIFKDPAGILRFSVMTHAQPFIGNECPAQKEALETFESGQSRVTELYRDQYGQWISAFAPIINSAGTVVGIIDVNRRSERYFERYELVARLTLVTGLLVLAMSMMLGWLVLNRVVMKPMRAVHQGMLALGRSEFGHRVNLRTRDEFEQLGNTFNNIARELNAARSVQASMLPKLMPQMSGWRIAGLSEPCDAAAGDYYDAFPLPGDRIAVVVADVTGHGLGPSLLMSACRSALRAFCRLDLAAEEVVSRLDALISEDLTEGKFITMLFGILEPDGRFTFCNAGHAPASALIGGAWTSLDAHRPPLGVLGGIDLESESTELRLREGDRILLASDGVSEAFNPLGEQFGEDRMLAIVGKTTGDPAATASSLSEAVTAHRGSRPQGDDITILIIDRVGDGS